jgi:hypothetical protein
LGIYALGLLIGTLLVSFFLALIGQQVREAQPRLGQFIASLPLYFVRVGGLALMAAVIVGITMLPFFALATILGVGAGLMGYAPPLILADLILRVGIFLCIWVCSFGFFTLHGILINGRGLFAALWDSIRIVQWNMLSTLLLILSISFLLFALQKLFLLAGTGSWLVLATMPAQAFLTTGLISATFMYFRDRHRYWRKMREILLAELERRRARSESNTL